MGYYPSMTQFTEVTGNRITQTHTHTHTVTHTHTHMRIALLATTTIFTLIGFKSFCCCCGKGWGSRQGGGQRESVACFSKVFSISHFLVVEGKAGKINEPKPNVTYPAQTTMGTLSPPL